MAGGSAGRLSRGRVAADSRYEGAGLDEGSQKGTCRQQGKAMGRQSEWLQCTGRQRRQRAPQQGDLQRPLQPHTPPALRLTAELRSTEAGWTGREAERVGAAVAEATEKRDWRATRDREFTETAAVGRKAAGAVRRRQQLSEDCVPRPGPARACRPGQIDLPELLKASPAV